MNEQICCWFCYDEKGSNDDLYFSIEFDCYVHGQCIKDEILNKNPEAIIMGRELDIK